MDTVSIIRPDDFHVHLRDGDIMRCVVQHTARQFARAVVMPNLAPAITTVQQAGAYRQRILESLDPGSDFMPLMVLYLTDATPAQEIRRLQETDYMVAVKMYPAGTTTNSAAGVTAVDKVYSILDTMQEARVPLLVHGEVADDDIDIFDRERIFIDRVLVPLLDRFPELRVVLEHITTREASDLVARGPLTLAATVTPQHLLLDRNDLLAAGVRPHNYCLPVLKRRQDREALQALVSSGHPRVFLGTDSAPHPRQTKESGCGCAGCYSAFAALELYAQAFERAGCLHRLEQFASLNGARFYDLEPNTGSVTLIRDEWMLPTSVPLSDDELVPLCAGDVCQWKVQ